jgi:hypothetical protein
LVTSNSFSSQESTPNFIVEFKVYSEGIKISNNILSIDRSVYENIFKDTTSSNYKIITQELDFNNLKKARLNKYTFSSRQKSQLYHTFFCILIQSI